MRKHYLTFKIVHTEPEAKAFCDEVYATYTPYMKRQYKKPSYTIWTSTSTGDDGFIIWYRY